MIKLKENKEGSKFKENLINKGQIISAATTTKMMLSLQLRYSLLLIYFTNFRFVKLQEENQLLKLAKINHKSNQNNHSKRKTMLLPMEFKAKVIMELDKKDNILLFITHLAEKVHSLYFDRKNN